MRKIIFILATIIYTFLLNNTPIFACQLIPEGYFKYLTLEETIASSENILIVKWSKNGPKTSDIFPNTSNYDWLELNIVETLKGNLQVNNKIKIKTADMCGYNTYYSDDMEIGKKYLIFLGTKTANDLWLPVVSDFLDGADQHRGLRQYEIIRENIDELNLTVQKLKNKILNPAGAKIYSVSEFQTFLKNNERKCDIVHGLTTTCQPYNDSVLSTTHLVEGFVISNDQVPINCPSNSDGTINACARPFLHRFLIINDSADGVNGLKILYGKYGNEEFRVGDKYVFTVTVINSHEQELSFDSYTVSLINSSINPKNKIKDTDARDDKKIPDIVLDNPQKNIFSRMWNFIKSIFK